MDSAGQSLSLRLPESDVPVEPLPDLLFRIGQQCGSFRDLTDDLTMQEGSVSNEEEAHSSKKADNLRDPLIKAIASALNECALALDATSLLLSANRSSAELTVSPALKQSVPLGSLGHGYSAVDQAQQHDLTIARGHKKEAFDKAHIHLQDAYNQAEKDSEDQKALWATLQDIIDDGWIIRSTDAGLAACYGSHSKNTILIRVGSTSYPVSTTTLLYSLQVEDESIDYNPAVITNGETMASWDDSLRAKRLELVHEARFKALSNELRTVPQYGEVYDDKIVVFLDYDKKLLVSLSSQSPQEKLEEDVPDEQLRTLLIHLRSGLLALQALKDRNPLQQIITQFRFGRAICKARRFLTTMSTTLQKYQYSVLNSIALEEDFIEEKQVFRLHVLRSLLTITVSSKMDSIHAIQFSIVVNQDDKLETHQWSTIKRICLDTARDEVVTYLEVSTTLTRCHRQRLKSQDGTRLQILLKDDASLWFHEVRGDPGEKFASTLPFREEDIAKWIEAIVTPREPESPRQFL